MLASEAHEQQKFPIARIWKNSAKWAYIDQSVHTTQAFPAHRSYFASGTEVTWAVLDSGIHWTHPHFGGEKGTLKSVYDCTSRKQRQVPAKDLQPCLERPRGLGPVRPRRARRRHHRRQPQGEGQGRQGARDVRHGAVARSS